MGGRGGDGVGGRGGVGREGGGEGGDGVRGRGGGFTSKAITTLPSARALRA